MERTYALPPELGIDDAETLARFGYAATAVSPGGSKKVIFRCAQCAILFARVRMRITASPICNGCSRAKELVGPVAHLVDWDATRVTYGYRSDELSRYDPRPVTARCTSCQAPFSILLRAVRPGVQCASCRRRSTTSVGSGVLDEAGTVARFGYSAQALSDKSFEYVVARCTQCHEPFERIRRNITDDARCAACARAAIDHEALQAKRLGTLAVLYPDGLPLPPSGYGVAAGELGDWLESKISRKLQREKALANQQRLDLYDEVTRVGIEYCGLHWHHENSPQPRERSYHYNKMRAAEAQQIRLVTVFEDEVLNHDYATRFRLLAILNHYERILDARKLTLAEVPAEVARAFYAVHHVQGAATSTTHTWGLFAAGELVGCLSLGPHHRQGHETDLVLTRLCFAAGTRIRGGAQRLWAAAKRHAAEAGTKRVISWSDSRWSTGGVYPKLGFQLAQVLGPDYSYVNVRTPRERLSKQSQKKSNTGCPPGVTERDWALQHGLSRIWDCGKKRWECVL